MIMLMRASLSPDAASRPAGHVPGGLTPTGQTCATVLRRIVHSNSRRSPMILAIVPGRALDGTLASRRARDYNPGMASSDIVNLEDGTFDQEVLKSETPVLVDFWA